MALSHLLLRRLQYPKPFPYVTFIQFPTKFVECFSSAAADSTQKSPPTPKTNSLTARMSFVFDELVEMDKQGDEKHQTLQRIRSWRQSKNESTKESVNSPVSSSMEDLKTELVKSEALMANSDVKKEVELVHPWPEWIELMERLVQHNYFDHMRKDEDGMMQGLGLDLSEAGAEVGSKDRPFTRDFKAVQAAMVNFGRDRFDILRKLSRQDIQILVGYGCPSEEKKAVFSSKLLRKHVHLDEGDVCSSCNLRSTCEKAYLLTNKEDEPQTLDIMRVLLAYGFDPVNGSFLNKSLLKMKSVKTVVRKLIHEVVKLSAVPLDPNLPRPVIKKAPPKVKTPPPPPRKRVGRSDVEMKKGDWLCPKCDFMNFAKNTICMQCDAKRPKRQLLPGEWECPQCNFLNYRRNTVCFHCEHNRPPDTYAVKDFTEQQNNPSSGMAKSFGRKEDVSNAWNFDFDDNESDGADVAAFEYADSQKIDRDFSLDKQNFRENSRGHQDNRSQREYSDPTPARPSTGFNDFDEDEDDVDSFEVVSQNEAPNPSRINLSELESDSESEDDTDKRDGYKKTNNFQARSRKPSNRKPSFSDDSDDNDLPVHPKWKSSHVADGRPPRRGGRGAMSFGSDDELGSSSGSDDEDLRSPRKQGNGRGSNRTGRMTRPQSKFSDSDDDFDNSRNNRRDNVGRASMGRGGFKRSSGFDRNGRGSREDVDDWPEKKGRSFDKRDGFVKGGRSSEKRGGLFGKRGGSFDDRGGGSFGKKGGSFEKRGGSFDDKHESFGERGGSFDDRGRSSGKRGGSFEKRGGSFEKRGGSFEKRGGSFERRGGSSGKRGGSFDKRGGRSNNYDNGSDNFPDDERHSRPRNNVR